MFYSFENFFYRKKWTQKPLFLLVHFFAIFPTFDLLLRRSSPGIGLQEGLMWEYLLTILVLHISHFVMNLIHYMIICIVFTVYWYTVFYFVFWLMLYTYYICIIYVFYYILYCIRFFVSDVVVSCGYEWITGSAKLCSTVWSSWTFLQLHQVAIFS